MNIHKLSDIALDTVSKRSNYALRKGGDFDLVALKTGETHAAHAAPKALSKDEVAEIEAIMATLAPKTPEATQPTN